MVSAMPNLGEELHAMAVSSRSGAFEARNDAVVPTVNRRVGRCARMNVNDLQGREAYAGPRTRLVVGDQHIVDHTAPEVGPMSRPKDAVLDLYFVDSNRLKDMGKLHYVLPLTLSDLRRMPSVVKQMQSSSHRVVERRICADYFTWLLYIHQPISKTMLR